MEPDLRKINYLVNAMSKLKKPIYLKHKYLAPHTRTKFEEAINLKCEICGCIPVDPIVECDKCDKLFCEICLDCFQLKEYQERKKRLLKEQQLPEIQKMTCPQYHKYYGFQSSLSSAIQPWKASLIQDKNDENKNKNRRYINKNLKTWFIDKLEFEHDCGALIQHNDKISESEDTGFCISSDTVDVNKQEIKVPEGILKYRRSPRLLTGILNQEPGKLSSKQQIFKEKKRVQKQVEKKFIKYNFLINHMKNEKCNQIKPLVFQCPFKCDLEVTQSNFDSDKKKDLSSAEEGSKTLDIHQKLRPKSNKILSNLKTNKKKSLKQVSFLEEKKNSYKIKELKDHLINDCIKVPIRCKICKQALCKQRRFGPYSNNPQYTTRQLYDPVTDEHTAIICVQNIRKQNREKEEKLLSMKNEIEKFEDFIKRQAQNQQLGGIGFRFGLSQINNIIEKEVKEQTRKNDEVRKFIQSLQIQVQDQRSINEGISIDIGRQGIQVPENWSEMSQDQIEEQINSNEDDGYDLEEPWDYRAAEADASSLTHSENERVRDRPITAHRRQELRERVTQQLNSRHLQRF